MVVLNLIFVVSCIIQETKQSGLTLRSYHPRMARLMNSILYRLFYVILRYRTTSSPCNFKRSASWAENLARPLRKSTMCLLSETSCTIYSFSWLHETEYSVSQFNRSGLVALRTGFAIYLLIPLQRRCSESLVKSPSGYMRS
jgi:hypothetical protein